MMDFLRPSPEVIAFLFLKTNVYYPIATIIAGVSVWRSTGWPRRSGGMALLVAAVGLITLTLSPHIPTLFPIARFFNPAVSAYQGMAWAGLCFALLTPATLYAGRWAKALSLSNSVLFIILGGAWMIAYSNILTLL